MSRGAVAAVVAVLGLAVAAMLLLEPSRPGGTGEGAPAGTSSTVAGTASAPEDGAAAAWAAGAEAAFQPLAGALPELLRAADAWRAGDQPDDALRAALDAHGPVLAGVARQVAQLEPLEGRPLVQPLMATSAELYVTVVDLQRAALEVEPGPLRTQVDLVARRTRVLADRIFDRARALLDDGTAAPVDPDITLSLPEEVPGWAQEQLAAGPPLAAEPPPADELYPQRQAARPVQQEAAWLDDVGLAAAPPGEEVRAALDRADPEALGALAEDLERAVELLRAAPDPSGAGGRERHTRLRLGLLLRAEAARAGQAAALAGGAAGETLAGAAEALAELGAGPALAGEVGPSR